MYNIWTSPRLLYRAVETDDEAFLAITQSDDEAYANSAPFILVPQGKKKAKESREWMETCLMAALICLPPSPEDEAKEKAKSAVATSDGEAKDGKESKEEAKSKGTPIGYICLSGSHPGQVHHRSTMIGLGVLRDHQGKGYGSEAIQWALRWGFMHGNLHRIEIGAFEWNERAWRLYERLGFRHEGRKRDAFWFRGRYWDGVEMGMLEGEWRERYGKEEEQQVVVKGGKGEL